MPMTLLQFRSFLQEYPQELKVVAKYRKHIILRWSGFLNNEHARWFTNAGFAYNDELLLKDHSLEAIHAIVQDWWGIHDRKCPGCKYISGLSFFRINAPKEHSDMFIHLINEILSSPWSYHFENIMTHDE